VLATLQESPELAQDSLVNDLFGLVWPEAKEKLGLTKETFIDYMMWHIARSYLTIGFEDGKPVGVMFYWRISDPRSIPEYPEIEEGEFVYCPFGVGSMDMFADMMDAAKIRFPGIKYFCFQREHRGDERVRVWRLKDE